MVDLKLSTGAFRLELNFRRIQQAQRKLGLSVWPMASDYAGTGPGELAHRIFAAAVEPQLTLDEAYGLIANEQDLEALGVAINEVMTEYQPEKWRALLTLMGVEMEEPKTNTAPPISGSTAGPSLVSTSASPEPTSESVPNANGRPSIAPSRRGKPLEKAVRLA